MKLYLPDEDANEQTERRLRNGDYIKEIFQRYNRREFDVVTEHEVIGKEWNERKVKDY